MKIFELKNCSTQIKENSKEREREREMFKATN